MTDAREMPEWPTPFDPAKQTLAQYLGNTVELEYERARAEAAMARLRLAKQYMRHASYCDAEQVSGLKCTCGTQEALSTIGEIPDA